MAQPVKTLPVTVLTGYLGAGKTTALNHLLTEMQGMRLCVLVNDFGAIALDQDLIVNQSGDTIALSNGCMCCTIGNDFYAAIDRILRLDPLPDHLVIETSGVADPFKVAQIALAEPDLHLQGVVTVVDALNLPAALADAMLGDTVVKQLQAAGLIAVTKSDLVDEAGLHAALGHVDRHAPATDRLIAPHGRIAADLFLSALTVHPTPAQAHHHHHDHDHGTEYHSWSWVGDAELSAAALDRLLSVPVPGLWRLKGIVRVQAQGWVAFHRAGAQSGHSPATAPQGLGGQGRAVAIGPAPTFDPAALERLWADLTQG